MTKKQLKKFNRNELIELSVQMNEIIDKINGYKSGINRNILAMFSDDELRDMLAKSSREYGVDFK